MYLNNLHGWNDKPTALSDSDAKLYAQTILDKSAREMGKSLWYHFHGNIRILAGIPSNKSLPEFTSKEWNQIIEVAAKLINEQIILAYPRDDNFRRGVKGLKGYDLKGAIRAGLDLARDADPDYGKLTRNQDIVRLGPPVVIESPITKAAWFNLQKVISDIEFPGIERESTNLDSVGGDVYRVHGKVKAGHLTVDQVRDICPSCADAMMVKGLVSISEEFLEKSMIEKAKNDVRSAPDKWVRYFEDYVPEVVQDMQKGNPDYDCLETYKGIHELYKTFFMLPSEVKWSHDLYKAQVNALSVLFGYPPGLFGRDVLEKAVRDMSHLHAEKHPVHRGGQVFEQTKWVANDDGRELHELTSEEHKGASTFKPDKGNLFNTFLNHLQSLPEGRHVVNHVTVSKVGDDEYVVPRAGNEKMVAGSARDIAAHIHTVSKDPNRVADYMSLYTKGEPVTAAAMPPTEMEAKRPASAADVLLAKKKEQVGPKPEVKSVVEPGKPKSKDDLLNELESLHDKYRRKKGQRSIADKTRHGQIHEELEALGHAETKHELGKRPPGGIEPPKPKRGRPPKARPEAEKPVEAQAEIEAQVRPESIEPVGKPRRDGTYEFYSPTEKALFDAVDKLNVGESYVTPTKKHIVTRKANRDGKNVYEVKDNLDGTTTAIPSRHGVVNHIIKQSKLTRLMTPEEKTGMESRPTAIASPENVTQVRGGMTVHHRSYDIVRRGQSIFVEKRDPETGKLESRVYVGPESGGADTVDNAFRLADHFGSKTSERKQAEAGKRSKDLFDRVKPMLESNDPEKAKQAGKLLDDHLESVKGKGTGGMGPGNEYKQWKALKQQASEIAAGTTAKESEKPVEKLPVVSETEKKSEAVKAAIEESSVKSPGNLESLKKRLHDLHAKYRTEEGKSKLGKRANADISEYGKLSSEFKKHGINLPGTAGLGKPESEIERMISGAPAISKEVEKPSLPSDVESLKSEYEVLHKKYQTPEGTSKKGKRANVDIERHSALKAALKEKGIETGNVSLGGHKGFGIAAPVAEKAEAKPEETLSPEAGESAKKIGGLGMWDTHEESGHSVAKLQRADGSTFYSVFKTGGTGTPTEHNTPEKAAMAMHAMIAREKERSAHRSGIETKPEPKPKAEPTEKEVEASVAEVTKPELKPEPAKPKSMAKVKHESGHKEFEESKREGAWSVVEADGQHHVVHNPTGLHMASFDSQEQAHNAIDGLIREKPEAKDWGAGEFGENEIPEGKALDEMAEHAEILKKHGEKPPFSKK